MAQASELQEQAKNSKKVQEIVRGFSELGDEGLAQKIQSEEYNKKYQWNRGERQVARQDVPLAIQTHTEEELRLQRENLERLEKLKKLAEQDAELARQIQDNETATLKRKKSRKADPQGQDVVTVSTPMGHGASVLDDEETAHLLVENEQLKKKKDKVQQEIKDHELAMELYNKDLRSYLHHPDSKNSQFKQINQGKLGGKVISLKDFSGFEVGDGISEEEKRELIKMQDEELARALQMSEEMKVVKKQTSAGEMERRDAELAWLIQKTEKTHIERHRSTGGNSSISHGMDSQGGYLLPYCDRRGSSGGPRHSSHSYAYENVVNNRACPFHSSKSPADSLDDEAFARSEGQRRDSNKSNGLSSKAPKK